MKKFSDKRINSIKAPDYGIAPKLNYGTKTRVEFNGAV